MGRTTDYTPKLAKEICYAVSCSSHGIKKLCKLNKHWPSHDTIYRWLANNIEFSDLYARAKRLQIEVIIDEILEIADDTSNDSIINEEDGRLTINHEHINRSRLKIDTRKWLAAKLCPRLYGDKDDAFVNLRFPSDIKNANSLLPMSTEVFRALGNQEITPGQAKTLLGTIKDYSNAIVIIDLNQKMSELLGENKNV
jgi:hypothetical protein